MEAQNKNSNPTQETVKARKTGLMSNEGQFRIGGRQLDNCKDKMEVGWQAENSMCLDDQMDLRMGLLEVTVYQVSAPFCNPFCKSSFQVIFV